MTRYNSHLFSIVNYAYLLSKCILCNPIVLIQERTEMPRRRRLDFICMFVYTYVYMYVLIYIFMFSRGNLEGEKMARESNTCVTQHGRMRTGIYVIFIRQSWINFHESIFTKRCLEWIDCIAYKFGKWRIGNAFYLSVARLLHIK